MHYVSYVDGRFFRPDLFRAAYRGTARPFDSSISSRSAFFYEGTASSRLVCAILSSPILTTTGAHDNNYLLFVLLPFSCLSRYIYQLASFLVVFLWLFLLLFLCCFCLPLPLILPSILYLTCDPSSPPYQISETINYTAKLLYSIDIRL